MENIFKKLCGIERGEGKKKKKVVKLFVSRCYLFTAKVNVWFGNFLYFAATRDV